MPVNTALLTRKLNAILAKDIPAIVAEDVYLPFLGRAGAHGAGGVAAWLKKRTDVLEDVRDGAYTDQQIATFVANVYNGLSAADKLIADDINAGVTADMGAASSAVAYEKLVVIVLYNFVTREE